MSETPSLPSRVLGQEEPLEEEGIDIDAAPADGLWPSDNGELPIEIRRVVAKLIAGPYLSARSERSLWATLIEHENIVRSRLSDVFLELVIDKNLQLAFARNVEVEGTAVPKLMRTHRLTHLATMLLVYLRQLQMQASSAGEAAYVDEAEIYTYLGPYVVTEGKMDESLINKRISSAITTMKKNFSLLEEVKGGGRYRISEIVALIVTPDFASEIRRQYEAIVAGEKLSEIQSTDSESEPADSEVEAEDEE